MLTRDQLKALRTSAPSNTKLSVSRRAKSKRQPPKTVYSGTGNMPLYVRDAVSSKYPKFTQNIPALRNLVVQVEIYASKHNNGNTPTVEQVQKIAAGIR